MKRRNLLAMLSSLGVGATTQSALAVQTPQNFGVGEPVKITKVKALMTAPERIRLVVVKVETNQPGLYGWGCATFTQRAKLAAYAVDEFLDPFLRGKDPDAIEDIWQSSYVSSYWRNGPVLNNAMSGVDMALWDIKGKRAGMPVYQLLGGKCRFAADLYAHASGRDPKEVEDNIRKWKERGYRHVRAQMATPGYDGGYGAGGGKADKPKHLPEGTRVFEPAVYMRSTLGLFDHLREQFGFDVELLHDIHERVSPAQALLMAKELEKHQLFFLEDPLPPEEVDFFRHIREQSATPIAMGELFNNPNEWLGLIQDRLIDYIRVHLSQIGGLTPGRKLAALCEAFGVKTAWHGPGDNSPFGHAANVALDLSSYNFGIQEQHIFNDAAQEVFPGCMKIENGYCFANEAPGWGIDVDEAKAKKFPIKEDPPFDLQWGMTRRRDGSVIRP
ncbi:MAG: enolase C-terminal domain-like protein [Candidatus Hinthialibacter antarcticus]|nr:enolase C-terminal domain-like protein [Candidatus Hinthialibacter antarcticus]